MAAKYKTLSVYPDPTARAIVGGNSPACNQAIECWAEVLRESHPTHLAAEDWCVLADVLNGSFFDSSWSGQFLVAEVSDAFALNQTDWKWYSSESQKAVGVHPRGKKLLELVASLDYAGIQAILATVRWFWDHHEEIEMGRDKWWTLRFRVAAEINSEAEPK